MVIFDNCVPAVLERLLALPGLPHPLPLALVLDLAAVALPDTVIGAESPRHPRGIVVTDVQLHSTRIGGPTSWPRLSSNVGELRMWGLPKSIVDGHPP